MCEHGDVTWMEELGPHGRYVDSCMVEKIRELIEHGSTTLACCCGHGKYPMTVVVEGLTLGAYEYFSDVHIPRTRRFYKMDDEDCFFIPEIKEIK